MISIRKAIAVVFFVWGAVCSVQAQDDVWATDTAYADSVEVDSAVYEEDTMSFAVRVPEVYRMSFADSLLYRQALLKAEVASAAGNKAEAFDLLQLALELNPRGFEAYSKISEYYSYLSGYGTGGIEALEAAMKLYPGDPHLTEQLFDAYVEFYRLDDAEKLADELVRVSSDRVSALQKVYSLYDRQENYKKLLSTLDKYELYAGQDPDLQLVRAGIYAGMKRNKKAENIVLQLIKEHPYEEQYKIAYVRLLIDNKKYKEAKKQIDMLERTEASSPDVIDLKRDYYYAMGDSLNIFKTELEILGNDKVSDEAKDNIFYTMILKSFVDSAYAQTTLAFFDTLITHHPDNPKFLIYKGISLQFDSIKAKEQEELYKRALELEPGMEEALGSLIQYWLRQLNTEGADKDSLWALIGQYAKQGVEYHPQRKAFYELWGQAAYMIKNYEEGIQASQSALRQLADNLSDDSRSEYYAGIAECYHELGKMDEMYAAYDSALVWNDENAGVLNNYAYYLAEKGEQLDKAETMILKVLDKDPNNANTLDTYAWVLFMKKDYENARLIIDMAIKAEKDSVSATLYTHAGDIYIHCGLQDEAVDYWKKALEKKPGDAALEEKIRQRKYIP